VLVVGGSRTMVGAPALACNAALRSGAGLAAFAAPQTVQLTIASICPCATSVPLSCGESGELTSDAIRQTLKAAEKVGVVAAGPGLAVGPVQQNIIRAILEQSKPLVLDADGLNNLCDIENWPTLQNCPLVLTPHPGEFSRLTGMSVGDIQSNREAVAVEAVRDWIECQNQSQPLVCVLKGAGTVVTDGRKIFVNQTGNPGMATGGSGDVLTGMVAALIGQGLDCFDAARLAVHTHGLAGDLAAAELSEISITAQDILDFLPKAFKTLV